MVISSTQIIHQGIAYAGIGPAMIAVRRGGPELGILGMGLGGAIGVQLDPLPGTDLDATYVRGVSLDVPSDSFEVEIQGLDAGKTAANSLVINLSLGWEPNGLTMSASYQSVYDAIATASCRGALSFTATSTDGLAELLLPAAQGFRGFRVDRVDFDPQTSTFDVWGRALRANGRPIATRIQVEPSEPVPGFSPSATSFTYDPSGNELTAWFVSPEQPSEEELPGLPRMDG